MTAAAAANALHYYSTYRQYRVYFNQFCRNAHRKYPYIHGKYLFLLNICIILVELLVSCGGGAMTSNTWTGPETVTLKHFFFQNK